MATKKGIILTAIILGAITIASFLLWIIPQHNNSIVITDFRNELQSVQERQGIIANEVESDLKSMLNGTMSPDDFISRAQISESQVNSLLTEIIESRAPQEWQDSYLNYGESLKNYNDYLTETIILANKLKGSTSTNDLKGDFEKIAELKKASESYALKSNETKP